MRFSAVITFVRRFVMVRYFIMWKGAKYGL